MAEINTQIVASKHHTTLSSKPRVVTIIVQLSALMKLNHKRRLCHGNNAAITTQHTLLLSVIVYQSVCIFVHITHVSCLSELQCKLGAIPSQTFPFPLQLQ